MHGARDREEERGQKELRRQLGPDYAGPAPAEAYPTGGFRLGNNMATFPMWKAAGQQTEVGIQRWKQAEDRAPLLQQNLSAVKGGSLIRVREDGRWASSGHTKGAPASLGGDSSPQQVLTTYQLQNS